MRITGIPGRLRVVPADRCDPYPDLQFDPLVLPEDRLDLEVDADGGDEGRGEGVVGVTEEEARLAHARVADDEQLEHVVKVLVRGVLLPRLALCCHL